MKFPPLNGLDFIEYASPEPEKLEDLFQKLGLVKTAKHNQKDVLLYQLADINFVINKEKDSFSENFMKDRKSPCVSSIAFRVDSSADTALDLLKSRGAKAVEKDSSHSFPALYGVGGSLIYLVDNYKNSAHWKESFSFFNQAPENSRMLFIDHLTNNVPTGEMNQWCEFYSELFCFTERRFFDIKGLKTGLLSKVMKSPCDTISIPINEPSADELGKKSQIQEYLDEYHGAGIQHIAFLTKNIVKEVEKLKKRGLSFLDTPTTYYEPLKARLPQIEENIEDLKNNLILADGDDKNYLLQIFTKNMIGPIFFELIERKGHDGFGEGNFQALFDAIERDQIKRGYL